MTSGGISAVVSEDGETVELVLVAVDGKRVAFHLSLNEGAWLVGGLASAFQTAAEIRGRLGKPPAETDATLPPGCRIMHGWEEREGGHMAVVHIGGLTLRKPSSLEWLRGLAGWASAIVAGQSGTA